ncbi:MAG: Rab family GTPase [Thermoplasmata archaeon]
MPLRDEVKVKLCLVGEGGVGKTSLIRRFIYQEFDDRYVTTIGAKVSKKEIVVREGDGRWVDVSLAVWDIMGQSSLRELLKEAYFTGARGALGVCDVTRRDTLEELHEWVGAIHRVTGDIPIHILANKVDLAERIDFEESDLAEVAASYKAPYGYTSAKSGENVPEAFQKLAEMIVR